MSITQLVTNPEQRALGQQRRLEIVFTDLSVSVMSSKPEEVLLIWLSGSTEVTQRYSRSVEGIDGRSELACELRLLGLRIDNQMESCTYCNMLRPDFRSSKVKQERDVLAAIVALRRERPDAMSNINVSFKSQPQ